MDFGSFHVNELMKQNETVIDFADIGGVDSGVEDTADSILRTYRSKMCKAIERVSEIALPEEGEQIRIVTKRSFSAIAFLQYIIEQVGCVDEALICIYSINYYASVVIDEMVNTGKIKQATVLMSNLRNTAHRKKEELTKQFFVNNPKIELIFAQSHAKIMSLKAGNQYFTIEGSGNLTTSSRIEQYVIDNDKELFNFTKTWIEEIKTYLQGKKELEIHPKLLI